MEKLRKQITPTLKKHDVIRAAIFGSYARGDQTSKSDIDLMIEFSGRKSLFDLVGLQLDLEDKTGKKFDVSTFKAINPLIRDRVFKDQILVLQ